MGAEVHAGAPRDGAGNYHVFQQVHRRPVRVGIASGLLGDAFKSSEIPFTDSRFRFRRFVDLSNPIALQSENVGFVVLHKDPWKKGRRRPEKEKPLLPLPSLDLRALVAHFEEAVGPPTYEDEDILVFSLDPAGG